MGTTKIVKTANAEKEINIPVLTKRNVSIYVKKKKYFKAISFIQVKSLRKIANVDYGEKNMRLSVLS